MLNSIRSFIRTYLVYFIIIIFNVMAFLLWTWRNNEMSWHELGLHVFAELLIMLFTLAIVENLIKKNKKGITTY
jgi:NADH:ubiquinone oxidoreductase subunit 3 (subunit A)